MVFLSYNSIRFGRELNFFNPQWRRIDIEVSAASYDSLRFRRGGGEGLMLEKLLRFIRSLFF